MYIDEPAGIVIDLLFKLIKYLFGSMAKKAKKTAAKAAAEK